MIAFIVLRNVIAFDGNRHVERAQQVTAGYRQTSDTSQTCLETDSVEQRRC